MLHARCSLGVIVLALAPLFAQSAVNGNGVPSAYVENSPGFVGGNLRVGYGSPTTPNGIAAVAVSGAFTPTLFPFAELGGPVAIDPLDPAFFFSLLPLDGAGNGATTVPTPPFFAAASPPLFVNAITFEGPQWSVSKTARIDWMAPNTWEPGPVGAPRQMHTATALGGPRSNFTEVLVCGGATGSIIVPVPMASAELFSPLTRTFTPLPTMALPRAGHRSVLLPNGLVLITGGVTSGGLVTATCEFYDRSGQVFLPAPPMSTPRSGHAATLLDDGRVLVTGGVSDWQNTGGPAPAFINALNTAQDTAEVFDSASLTWSSLPALAARRLGHTQTKLADGRVLIVSGITGGYGGALNGGQIARYTVFCEVFDPVLNTFSPTGSLQHPVVGPFSTTTYFGRAFHGAGVLPSGKVVVTGGLVAVPAQGTTNDVSIVVPFCDQWDPQTGQWSQIANLLGGLAYHGMEPFGNGFVIAGGLSGSLESLATQAATGSYDGTTSVLFGPIPGGPRGAHTMTRLADGTFLVVGGGAWPATLGDSWIFAPQ